VTYCLTRTSEYVLAMREHSRFHISLVCAASLAVLACRPGATAGPIDLANISGPALIFDDVHVFDGVDDLGIVDVVVEGETIAAIGTVDLDSLPPAADVTVIEGHRKLTLLPGLIDAHAHVQGSADLVRATIFGVTTVLDQFMNERTMGLIKREQAKQGFADRADLRSAGLLATAPNGHGTEYGIEIPTVASPADVPAWMAERIEAGVDWIKISYDDGHAFGRSLGNFDSATLAALIDAAHEHDKLAIVHVSDREAAREAAKLGADGLAHVFFDVEADDDFVALAIERELFITDTLVVVHAACGDPALLEAVAQPGLLALADPGRMMDMRTMLARARLTSAAQLRCETADASVLRLHEAGIDLLASTDAPNFGLGHGLAMHFELGLLVDAGLSPRAALRAATEAPARRFGLTDRGRIAPGLRADLLLVDGDPTLDIRATGSIVSVWKAGQAIDLEPRRAKVAEIQAQLDAHRNAPAPAGAESGWVSNFDDDTLAVQFGDGWEPATDERVGGSSTATLTAVNGAMHITGRVEEHEGLKWAGANFFPAPEDEVADLGKFQSLEMEVQGTPGWYTVLIYSGTEGAMPGMYMFEIPSEPSGEHVWFTVSAEFAEMGIEGWGMALVFVGRQEVGEFELRIDNVRFR
jgi:imidazolonepropionase-like amidohydrolase